MQEEIGAGRFGPAFRAQDANGSVVAVKVFDQGLTPEQAFALAAALKRLSGAPLDHPSIVPLVAAGLEGGRLWAAEPWIEGTPLDEVMRREGAQPASDVFVRVTQMAGALDFAAAAGIHHGALHPRDILIVGDRTTLTDIGVVQALGEAGLEVPMQGAYVSPQRARGLPLTARDDIFSLAAITYELVYGTVVPDRSDLRARITRLTGVDHTRFADVLEGSLSPDPLDRPSTGLELAAALQQALIPIPIPIPDSPIPLPHSVDDLPLRARESESEPEPESRSRSSASESAYGYKFAVATGLAIGLLAGFAAGFVAGQRDETPLPRQAERAVTRAERQAQAPEGKPAPPAGRDFTESDVQRGSGGSIRSDGSVGSPETIRGSEPQRPAERTERNERAERNERPERLEPPEPLERGALHVDSRPRGARVFVDGRLVGSTPLLLPDVNPGAHAVRIDLSGYERWVTSVAVTPGTRQRVAASLTLSGER